MDLYNETSLSSGSSAERMRLIHYTTLGCHLCDQAKAVYQAILNPDFFYIQEVDIADSDDLINQYGVRIPVIKRADNGAELGWPFDQGQLVDFLSEA